MINDYKKFVRNYVTTKLYILLLFALSLYYLFKQMYEVAFMLMVLLVIYIQIKNNMRVEMYEEEEEEEDDDDDYQEEEVDTTDFNEDNLANNALQYASIVSTPSPTATYYKHLPKETRYSFLENDEVRDVKHKDGVYRKYQYMKKVLYLQQQEDKYILDNRLYLYKVKDEKTFEEYCKLNNNLSFYNNIKHNKEAIKLILLHINDLKQNGYYKDIMNQNENVASIYKDYHELYNTPQHIDDLGMTGAILATSVVSMGRSGNERQAQITTISATRDLDLKKEQEEKTDFKNKFNSFIERFK